ncbi:MAG: FG-GAP repeat protein [Methanomicrobiaceae archaeon]|nr:FG-GAP repeat protein [Methanomicrobiaceae archaeon]
MGVGVVSADAQVAAAGAQGQGSAFRLTAGDPVAAAEFGRSVAIDGDLVAVGAGGATADSVDNAGAVYLYGRQGRVYVPEAKLIAPDATGGAEFGRAVAIQGNMVFVGARFAQAGDFDEAGAVYVFKKYQGSWHLEEKIISPDPENRDNFGRALAIQGNLLVVTARKESDEEGAAYVFVDQGGLWTYQQKLTASDGAPRDFFGQSVAVQGNLMAIGARNADPGAAGAVYLFSHSAEGWEEIAKLKAPELERNKNDQFGFTVAIAGDTIAVGARRADPDSLKDAGAAYVYTLDGNFADLVARLTPSDASEGDEFGQSIAIAGNVLAVGAWKDAIDGNEDQGSVYLFRRMGNRWIETGTITASDGMAGDEFGYSLSAFGNRMVTGAHFADATAGAAYVLPLKI